MYLDDKETYLGTREHRKITIVFRSLSDDAVGVCKITPFIKREINIDPEYWYSINPAERQILFYHEMGHCDLNRDHSEPYSIMEPSLFGTFRFLNNKEYYLKEFFGLIPLESSLKVRYSTKIGGQDGEGTNNTCGTNWGREDNIFQNFGE